MATILSKLKNPNTKIDYIYSNNKSHPLPFYYDTVRIYGDSEPVCIPVPILIKRILYTKYPKNFKGLRRDPEARALEVAYKLREKDITFDMKKIISKTRYRKELK